MTKLLALAVLLGGCNLYFGHQTGEDDIACPEGAAPSLSSGLRNPATGICETFTNPCDGVCGPCASGVLLPDWPMCQGACDALDEASCLTTAGCHASFIDGGGPNPWQAFLGCWDTQPAGPIEGGDCTLLGADECLRHDDCSSNYINVQDGSGTSSTSFESCIAEPGSADPCATVDCSGQCEVQCTACDPTADSTCVPFCQAMCVPDPTCQPDSCPAGSTCVQQCDALATGLVGACTITCMPDTACAALPSETACKGRADCEPVYKGTDCTCFPDHCVCNTETYERCQPLQ